MKQYNKFEHSVIPSLDYNFANEKYSYFHPWYKFTNDLKKSIEKYYEIEVYNIKLTIHSFGYNLYIYLFDSTDFHKLPLELTRTIKDPAFIKLVDDQILKHKPKDIIKKKMNPNGVFIQDYRNSYISYCINKSYQRISTFLLGEYSMIKKTSYWDSILYLFIESDYALNDFENIIDVSTLKLDILKIIKSNDSQNLFSIQDVKIKIDDLDLYHKIGGQNYFRSDAMIEAKSI